MNKREIVQTLLDSVQKGDFEKAKSLLTDDFQFSGPVPEPVTKDSFLGMTASLKIAFPDRDYHFKVIGADDDVVRTTSQLSGTHRGSFDLTDMNMGVIPATKKSFINPNERGKVTVRGGKVTSWVVESIAGGGLMGILGQLGVRSPTV